MTTKRIISAVIIIFCFGFLLPVRADYCDCGDRCEGTPPNCGACVAKTGDCPYNAAGTGTDASNRGDRTVSLTSPISATNVPQIIGTVVKAVLGVVGALALLVFIKGGFTWLTSAGNAEKVKEGAQGMMWAVAGLVVIFASYLFVDTILFIFTSSPK